MAINASQRKFINDNNWMRDNVSHAKTFIECTLYIHMCVLCVCIVTLQSSPSFVRLMFDGLNGINSMVWVVFIKEWISTDSVCAAYVERFYTIYTFRCVYVHCRNIFGCFMPLNIHQHIFGDTWIIYLLVFIRIYHWNIPPSFIFFSLSTKYSIFRDVNHLTICFFLSLSLCLCTCDNFYF